MIRCFGGAVPTYDRDARMQDQVAGTLDCWMAERVPPDVVRNALEIGCGTGMLTRRIIDRWPQAQWLITDLSPEMVDECEASLSTLQYPSMRFDVLDGEEVAGITGLLDLIVSSLAVQWFRQPFASVRAWKEKLAPSGWLVFSTLTAGPIPASAALPDFPQYEYPGTSDWKRELEDDRHEVHTKIWKHCERHADVHSFLKTLQRIGASTPPADSRMSRSQLRRAILESRRNGEPLEVEYDVLIVAIRRR